MYIKNKSNLILVMLAWSTWKKSWSLWSSVCAAIDLKCCSSTRPLSHKLIRAAYLRKRFLTASVLWRKSMECSWNDGHSFSWDSKISSFSLHIFGLLSAQNVFCAVRVHNSEGTLPWVRRNLISFAHIKWKNQIWGVTEVNPPCIKTRLLIAMSSKRQR